MPQLFLRPSPGHQGPAHTKAKVTFATSPVVKRSSDQPRNSIVGILSRATRGATGALLRLGDGLAESERHDKRRVEERKRILSARLQNAYSYDQWEASAHELDVIEGNDEWKKTETGDYKPDVIQARLKELDDARTAGDVRAMMHLLRTSLCRDLGGMGNIDLYRHSYCGTKKLIERYVESALQTIATLVEHSSCHSLPDDMDTKDFLDAMLFARQSFGRSALLLSGGGTFGMTHIGVLKAMYEVKLLPRIISGASAGSIVCAVVCAKTDDEIPQLLEDFPHGDLAVFEEKGNEDGVLDHLRRLLTEGKWSDITHLTRVMRNLLGDITFQEAYNRTRRVCNITVSSASIYEMPKLLNYVTAPNVMIWSAVAASCSVPLIFSAAPLLVKNPVTGEHVDWTPTPQRWVDGSLDNDLPMTRLAEMFNVNHFIVSQVNPHVVPFLTKYDSPTPAQLSCQHSASSEENAWLYTMTQLAKSEAMHRMQVLAEIGIFPNAVSKLRSILSQKYSGDINILPAIGMMDLPKILKNPTTDFMLNSCLLGERATWPKLSRIRDRCAIELALDRAVHALRARVVFSGTQVELRRMAATSFSFRGGQGLLLQVKEHQPGSASANYKLKDRRRRSSFALFSVFPDHVTDESEEESGSVERGDCLKMLVPGESSTVKTKVNRCRSRTALLPCGPMTTPVLSSSNEPDLFDFTRPLSPIKSSLRDDSSAPTPKASAFPTLAGGAVPEESPSITITDTASWASPAYGAIRHAVLDSSNVSPTDADVDSRADDKSADRCPLDASGSLLDVARPKAPVLRHTNTSPLVGSDDSTSDIQSQDVRRQMENFTFGSRRDLLSSCGAEVSTGISRGSFCCVDKSKAGKL